MQLPLVGLAEQSVDGPHLPRNNAPQDETGRRAVGPSQRSPQLIRYHSKLKHDPNYKAKRKEYMAKWMAKNREDNRIKCREHYERNKDLINAEARAKRAERLKHMPKRLRLTAAERRSRKKGTLVRFLLKNGDRYKERRRECGRQPSRKQKWNEARNRRFKNNPEFTLRHRLRTRMMHALHGELKAAKTMELVGCSSANLKAHIESTWAQDMSWANYGSGHGKWVVDHVRPLASFSLHDPEQQRIAFHFSNLKAEWWMANAEKAARWNGKTYWKYTPPKKSIDSSCPVLVNAV